MGADFVIGFFGGIFICALWQLAMWADELAQYERISAAAQERLRREFR